MDPITGLLAGAGSLAGGVMGMIGQNSANQTNRDIASQTNAFNAQQAEKQMSFQQTMSNTAHQREVADLEAAGLNPILSATGGSGASTPSGASASGTTGAAQQNSLGELGKAVGQTVPSALQASNMQKDLESKDAGIQAQKAAAISSLASANNANTNAEATRADMPSIHARAHSALSKSEADISESNYRKESSDYNRPYIKWDGMVKRAGDATGVVSDAISAAALATGKLPALGGLFKRGSAPSTYPGHTPDTNGLSDAMRTYNQGH